MNIVEVNDKTLFLFGDVHKACSECNQYGDLNITEFLELFNENLPIHIDVFIEGYVGSKNF